MALDLSSSGRGPSPGAAATAGAQSQALPWWQLSVTGGHRMGARERMLLTERLLLLLETGVSLHQALRELRVQESHPGVAAVLDAVSDSVLEGQPLSAALQRHPELFPPTYVNLVSAGERGGFLPQVLQQLLEMDEKAERLRATIASALSYPAFLIVFSLAVIVFVLVGVFPKFADMFEQIRNDLPWSTRALMALSDGLRLHWPWVLLALGGLAGGTAALLRRPEVLERLDALKLGLPGHRKPSQLAAVGRIFHHDDTAIGAIDPLAVDIQLRLRIVVHIEVPHPERSTRRSLRWTLVAAGARRYLSSAIRHRSGAGPASDRVR